MESGQLHRIADRTPRSDSRRRLLYVERGQWHYRRNEWGEALNDFNRALKIDPDHREARQFVEMTYEILSFRHTDIYNP